MAIIKFGITASVFTTTLLSSLLWAQASCPVAFFHDCDKDAPFLSGKTWGYWSGNEIGGNRAGFLKEDFQSHRSGFSGFSYKVEGLVEGRQYLVKLGFAEVYEPNCEVGRRVMNVLVNGNPVLSEIDVFAEVGCFAALVVEKKIHLEGSTVMEIGFTSTVENPMVSIIEVTEDCSTDVPTFTPTTMPTLPATEKPTPEVTELPTSLIPVAVTTPAPTSPTAVPTALATTRSPTPALTDDPTEEPTTQSPMTASPTTNHTSLVTTPEPTFNPTLTPTTHCDRTHSFGNNDALCPRTPGARSPGYTGTGARCKPRLSCYYKGRTTCTGFCFPGLVLTCSEYVTHLTEGDLIRWDWKTTHEADQPSCGQTESPTTGPSPTDDPTEEPTTRNPATASPTSNPTSLVTTPEPTFYPTPNPTTHCDRTYSFGNNDALCPRTPGARSPGYTGTGARCKPRLSCYYKGRTTCNGYCFPGLVLTCSEYVTHLAEGDLVQWDWKTTHEAEQPNCGQTESPTTLPTELPTSTPSATNPTPAPTFSPLPSCVPTSGACAASASELQGMASQAMVGDTISICAGEIIDTSTTGQIEISQTDVTLCCAGGRGSCTVQNDGSSRNLYVLAKDFTMSNIGFHGGKAPIGNSGGNVFVRTPKDFDGEIRIGHCKFSGGDGYSRGGNLYISSMYGDVYVDESTFLDATKGGNLYIDGRASNIHVTNSNFEGGLCSGLCAGGITIDDVFAPSTPVNISDCTFHDNQGGIAGAVNVRDFSRLTLTGNGGSGNTASRTTCGGIMNRNICLDVWEEL